ncbi:response regulator transcription factor [Bacillus massiliigorillae]|uniref:response regulator transcription factor n=1 Tax=Bacillus massiliigorillae TaxID=1243664 RepID=UPI00039C33B1|nr:response regulator transcription factor [Bacillus massiliigorillae]
MINILLVDDHVSVAEGTKALLEQTNKFSVSICFSPNDVLQKMKATKYDLFLFDLYMPELNGIELSKIVFEKNPEARIIIYTGYDLNTHFNLIVESGVSGFISKTASNKQLVRAIECALNDEVIIPLQLFHSLRKSKGIGVIEGNDRKINVSLTEREQEILICVSKGLTNKEISEKLIVSQRLVEYDLTSIFQKLKVKSRTEALMKASKYQLLDFVNAD